MNNVLVVLIAGVGASFMVCLYTDYYRSAGYLEWTITYLGSIWLGTFAGYIWCVFLEAPFSVVVLTASRFREAGGVAQRDVEPEQQPLLAPM